MPILKPNPLWCELFVDATVARSKLSELVGSIIGGSVDKFDDVVSYVFDISVKNNEFFNSPKYGEPIPPDNAPDRYMYFPYRIDIEPTSSTTVRERYIGELSNLIRRLQEQDFKVTAVCSFKNELKIEV